MTSSFDDPGWRDAVLAIGQDASIQLDLELLRRYRFDPALFSDLRSSLGKQGGTLEPLDARSLALLEPGDVRRPAPGPGPLHSRGAALLSSGRVAMLVWAGGMATRFGGVVKACVPALDQLTFLGAKARDASVRRSAGLRIPFVVMTSFATDDAIRAELKAHQNYGIADEDLFVFTQSVSLRLTPEGALFGEAGQASPYAPGHGDFFRAFRDSGTLASLRARGVTLICASNVDNLGALVDETLFGQADELMSQGCGFVAEVTRAREGEKGASAVRVDGEVRLVEYVRLPSGMALPDALLNTNNLYFDAAAIDRPLKLPYFPVQKKIGGQSALQFEQITCEICGVHEPDGKPVLPLGLIEVDRDGARGRFFPVKEPSDLEAMRPALLQRLQSTGWPLLEQP
jgi:UTP--glucose-1-phosphate uridylyltransferase